MTADEDVAIPADIDYAAVRGRQSGKARAHRPLNVGQAARIAGVTPAAISLLLVHLKKFRGRLARSA